MRKSVIYTLSCIFAGCLMALALPSAMAQLMGVGYKQNKSGMFQATFNYPLIFNSNKPYEIMMGVDYTTKNKNMPSGLAPQASFMYYLSTGRQKDDLLGTGVHAGYLLDFNRQFENQIRLTPFIYYEWVGLLHIKAGLDYHMPLNKSYPYISIGFGGLHMFKDFQLF